MCTDDTQLLVCSVIFLLLDCFRSKVGHHLASPGKRGVCPFPNPICYCTMCPYVPVCHFKMPFCQEFRIQKHNKCTLSHYEQFCRCLLLFWDILLFTVHALDYMTVTQLSWKPERMNFKELIMLMLASFLRNWFGTCQHVSISVILQIVPLFVLLVLTSETNFYILLPLSCHVEMFGSVLVIWQRHIIRQSNTLVRCISIVECIDTYYRHLVRSS